MCIISSHSSNTFEFFIRNNFSVYVDSFVVERIHSIASNYASWDDHIILNECYSCPRSQYLLPRIRTSRCMDSFIPTSTKVLNHIAIPWDHCNLSMTKLPNKSYVSLYYVALCRQPTWLALASERDTSDWYQIWQNEKWARHQSISLSMRQRSCLYQQASRLQ